ncbi:MAG: hypothetical protein KGL10_07480 [Alphaproteobacteria bacterium]|nr:hypothetical protein [Alphaproteobacteria bacterium]MDE2337136.1 hypothetical protein [Alphaproteobacteria bacterium]
MTEETDIAVSPKLQETCTTLYIVYALGAVLQFFDDTMLAGLLALAIAGALANRNRKKFRGTIFESHLRWMNRTLWIGALALTPAAIALTCLLLFTFTDAGTLVRTLTSGNLDAIMAGTQGYLAGNLIRLEVITETTTALPVLWFVRRCWRGYVFARDAMPVDNVTSWS